MRSFLSWAQEFPESFGNLTAGAAGLGILSEPGYSGDTELSIVGPKKGYTPQIGTLVSEMAFMRWQVMNSVKGTSQTDLDFLFDDKAKRIGATASSGGHRKILPTKTRSTA